MMLGTDWFFTFVFCVGIIGFLVSGILYLANKNESFTARILAAYLFCVSFVCLNFNFTLTDFYQAHPHFWRTAVIPSLCIPALAYLYTRSVLAQQFRFRRYDVIFFLPALLYTLNMLPLYLQPTTEKLKIIAQIFKDRSLIGREPDGMLPQGWGYIFRMMYGLSLAIAQYVLILRNRKKIHSKPHQSQQNLDILNWLTFFNVTISLTYFILLVEAIMFISRYLQLDTVILFTIACNILFISGYLLIRPNILYGLTGWLQEQANGDETTTHPADELKKEAQRSFLTKAQEKSYKALLEQHFQANKPFIKPGYKILVLSEELNIPTYQLSAFINQEYGKNFNELVNEYRVLYLVDLFKTDPAYFNYTLEAMGNLVGFNSRSSFINAVKKLTGQTPLEYFGKFKPAETT